MCTCTSHTRGNIKGSWGGGAGVPRTLWHTSLYSRDKLVENKSGYVTIVSWGVVSRSAVARARAGNRVCVLSTWAGVFEGGSDFREKPVQNAFSDFSALGAPSGRKPREKTPEYWSRPARAGGRRPPAYTFFFFKSYSSEFCTKQPLN